LFQVLYIIVNTLHKSGDVDDDDYDDDDNNNNIISRKVLNFAAI